MPRPKIAEKSTSLTLKVDSDMYELISLVAKMENKSVAALAREAIDLGWRELFTEQRLEEAQTRFNARIADFSDRIAPSPAGHESEKTRK